MGHSKNDKPQLIITDSSLDIGDGALKEFFIPLLTVFVIFLHTLKIPLKKPSFKEALLSVEMIIGRLDVLPFLGLISLINL